MSSHGQNRYRADLREIRFLLFEQFRLQELLAAPPFEAWAEDDVSMVLDEAYRFCREVVGPLNASGDREGCRIEAGRVRTPQGFVAAWTKLYEAGWKSLSVPPEHDGQGAPTTLHVVVEEFLAGANVAFSMYAGLAYGAAEVIAQFGTAAQRALYLKRMYGGQWCGTMCLTEPQAGSDVGASRTSARKLDDGRYEIRGTKIFISGGDHDLTENIIHLVLARVDGAPAGTKGLSLFLVPAQRCAPDGTLLGDNDVTVGGLEHKMGIRGSSTCVLNFGERGGCVGELLGAVESVGMTQMFKMMNNARIAVGLQSVGVASTAFLNALEYAHDRKQGPSVDHWKDPLAPRVPIAAHPDVRRMLLDMKSRVEGIRALIVKLAHHQDAARVLQGKDDTRSAYHRGQIDLLVPLVKAYGSDQAFRVCETAIQTFGGAGYVEDYPVEQYCRDAKIFSIYEGTNHIQAMDLVGRKLSQEGGANMQAFLGDVGRFVTEHADHVVLSAAVKELRAAHEALGATTMRLIGWYQGGQLALFGLVATRFLEMMSEVAVGWLLLEGAVIAEAALASADPKDRLFYAGKRAAAQYFALNVLPHVRTNAEILAREDRSALDIPLEGFAQA